MGLWKVAHAAGGANADSGVCGTHENCGAREAGEARETGGTHAADRAREAGGANGNDPAASALREAMLLYAVTDRAWLGGRTLAECVQQTVDGGATFVQLREKEAPHDEVASLARELLQICRAADVPFVIDDDVDIALEVGADGVHVGQDDLACVEARRRLGPDAIVGVSVQTLGQALAAQEAGADYLGVGALIPTPTKPDAVDVSREELIRICAVVSIPIVGIGGLNGNTIGDLAGSGLDGAAVVSAIFAADDCHEATRALRTVCEQTFRLA